tara:strand:+ start:86 stop:301 length:216 start_codon:yes stop_codon:yes gene_type:complete
MGRSLRNQIHLEAKRELRKKELVEKILESESEKKRRLKKEKTLQGRLNKVVRTIDNSHTSLGEMNHNKDTD